MNPLVELFPDSHDAEGFVKEFYALRRRGHLALALPRDERAATATLDLYPAQKPLARVLRGGLRFLCQLRLPPPLPRFSHRFDRNHSFTNFLGTLAPGLPSAYGQLGILPGNPRAAGRRWLVALFESGTPIAVVKAGTAEQAIALIAREAAFLESVTVPGIVKPLAAFRDETAAAFAMDFWRGSAPRRASPATVQRVLQPWVSTAAALPLGRIPAWERLTAACARDAGFARFCVPAAASEVQSAVMHGDFAPWNIKIDARDGVWRVLDWERGETCGVPGWDWFHFLVQPAILVARRPAPKIAEQLEALWLTPEFRGYAAAARIGGDERALALGYAFYCRDVQRQADGAAEIAALAQHLVERWAND